MTRIRVKGLRQARNALNREIAKVEGLSKEIVGEILQGVAVRTRPYVPEDTLTLLNSERIVMRSGPSRANGFLGYGYGGGRGRSGTPVAEYYSIVHDGPQKNWKKPGASNRYLEKGYRDFLQYDLRDVLARFM